MEDKKTKSLIEWVFSSILTSLVFMFLHGFALIWLVGTPGLWKLFPVIILAIYWRFLIVDYKKLKDLGHMNK